MNNTIKNIINVVLFQAGWFLSVSLGSSGSVFKGAFLMFALASLSLLLTKDKILKKFLFMIVVLLIGTLLDSILLFFGVYGFKTASPLPWPYPIWMSVLWYGFASTVDLSLSWLRNNTKLLVLFGLLGGPPSYYIGSNFGEMVFPKGVVFALITIGIFWALMTPLIFIIAEKFNLFDKEAI